MVTDATTGGALIGASISTLPATTSSTTNAQGLYVIASVAPGAYVVQASASAYASGTSTSIAVIAGETATANIALAETPVSSLTVTTTADGVNGDTANTRTLSLSPGPDGISLREAILAVNHTQGAHTITFSPSLVGRSIGLLSPLPIVVRDSTSIIGAPGSDGAPGVTLDGSGTNCCEALMRIEGSAITVSGLRFANFPQQALKVVLGLDKLTLTDLTFAGNVFDNRPSTAKATGIFLTSGAYNNFTPGLLARVNITANTFIHIQGDGDAILVGSDGVVEGLDVSYNTFVDCNLGVELAHGRGSNNIYRGTRIHGNSFTGTLSASIDMASYTGTGNLIDSTSIYGNRFTTDVNWALLAIAGETGSTGNTISTLSFANNVVDRSSSGVGVIGGNQGANGNQVSGVRMTNNTFYRSSGVMVNVDGSAASGNSITGFDLRNSIFWSPGVTQVADFSGRSITPGMVSFTITTMTGFAGANGDFAADPLFVSPNAGDFHLQAGSPAIGAGTSIGAPTTDLACYSRSGMPDLGAYAFGSAANLCMGTRAADVAAATRRAAAASNPSLP